MLFWHWILNFSTWVQSMVPATNIRYAAAFEQCTNWCGKNVSRFYVKGSLFEGYWFKVQSCHIKDWMYLYLWLYKLTCSKYCIQERDWLIVSLLCPIHHIVGLKLAGSKCDALHSWGRHQWRWRWWDGGELPPANPILIFCTRPRLPVFWAPPLPPARSSKCKNFPLRDHELGIAWWFKHGESIQNHF